MPLKTYCSDPYSAPLQLAVKTRLQADDIQLLAQALRNVPNFHKVLKKLPDSAIEPFLAAAYLVGGPLDFEDIYDFLPRLADPRSFVRCVAFTHGYRADSLVEMARAGVLDPLRSAIALFLCFELKGCSTHRQRVAMTVCMKRGPGWLGMLLLGEAAVGLDIPELSADLFEAVTYAGAPPAQEVVAELRECFRRPLAQLQSQPTTPGGPLRLAVYRGCQLPLLTRDGYLSIPIDEVSKRERSGLEKALRASLTNLPPLTANTASPHGLGVRRAQAAFGQTPELSVRLEATDICGTN